MFTQMTSFATGLKKSNNFENEVVKIIENELKSYHNYKNFNDLKSITIWDAGIALSNGYGQYKKFVDIEVNGENRETLKVHTTSAPDYDFFKKHDLNKTYSNALKNLIKSVIEERIDDVVELIGEKEEIES